MKLFQQGKDLRGKVVNAAFWSFLLHIAGRALNVLRTIVVARILAPDDIGLFALATLVLLSVELFTRTGFQSALIHREGDITNYLNVAWATHIMRGFLRAGMMAIAAPLAAIFFNEAALQTLILMAALSVVLSGLNNTGVIYFRKELHFQKHFFYMLSRPTGDLIVSIIAATILQNAWGLVYGLVAGFACQLIVSFLAHPFRPRFHFTMAAFKKLFQYGKWMNLTGMMIFLGDQLAGLVVGKMINAYALGLYHLAFWLAQTALVEVAETIDRVAFPAYAKLQDDLEKFRAAFRQITGFMVTLIIPVVLLILLTADSFVPLILGTQWLEMIPVLRILIAAGFLLTIGLAARPVFLGIGMPENVFRMQAIRGLTLVLCLYPLVANSGITGAGWAIMISNTALLGFVILKLRAVLMVKWEDARQIFLPGFFAGSLMVLVYFLTEFFLSEFAGIDLPASNIFWFAVQILPGVSVFILSLILTQKFFPDNQPLVAIQQFFSRKK